MDDHVEHIREHQKGFKRLNFQQRLGLLFDKDCKFWTNKPETFLGKVKFFLFKRPRPVYQDYLLLLEDHRNNHILAEINKAVGYPFLKFRGGKASGVIAMQDWKKRNGR